MIPHNRPTIGSEEEEAVTRVLRSGNLANGTEVSSFEKEFSEYMGLKKEHSVAVSNGTSALFLSLWALDANSKKIAFPSYVCSALRHAVGMFNKVKDSMSIENFQFDIKKLKYYGISRWLSAQF